MTSANNTPALPSFSPTTAHPRRASYATVAAGLNPSRFNTLAAFGAPQNSSSASLPQQQQQHHSPPLSRQRSRSSLRSMEIDGQGGSWKRPGSSWSNEIGRLDGRMGCTLHEDHPPFFTPSYLRHSRHVQRLQQRHEEHMAELQENMQLHPPRQPSLSTSSSNANLSKLPALPAQYTHRGPVQDVRERLTQSLEEDKSHPLPSRWNEDDKAAGLEILADGTEVRFNGITKQQDEAASVRADHPMPKEAGLYYFEVTVLSRFKEVYVGIGFSGPKVQLCRLPGWEADSWAYHGDDGYSFSATSAGKPFGPKFSAMDVIGCGVNFRTGNVFFTKNGDPLGMVERDRNILLEVC